MKWTSISSFEDWTIHKFGDGSAELEVPWKICLYRRSWKDLLTESAWKEETRSFIHRYRIDRANTWQLEQLQYLNRLMMQSQEELRILNNRFPDNCRSGEICFFAGDCPGYAP